MEVLKLTPMALGWARQLTILYTIVIESINSAQKSREEI